jgi:hypothetical protein
MITHGCSHFVPRSMITGLSHGRSPDTTRTAFALAAEADGNRTRRRRDAPSTGFEDRGGHQAP